MTGLGGGGCGTRVAVAALRWWWHSGGGDTRDVVALGWWRWHLICSVIALFGSQATQVTWLGRQGGRSAGERGSRRLGLGCSGPSLAETAYKARRGEDCRTRRRLSSRACRRRSILPGFLSKHFCWCHCIHFSLTHHRIKNVLLV